MRVDFIIIKKCTYLSDTVTQNAAGAHYTVNKLPAYNIGDSELATSGQDLDLDWISKLKSGKLFNWKSIICVKL